MSKAYTEEFLNDFLDDLLTGPELLRAKTLLADDAEFREEVEQWQTIRQTIKALPRPALSSGFHAQILNSLTTASEGDHPVEPLRHRRVSSYWNWRPFAAILGALAALLLIGFFFQYRQDLSHSVASSKRAGDQPESASTHARPEFSIGKDSDVAETQGLELKAGLPPAFDDAIPGSEIQKKDLAENTNGEKTQDPAKLDPSQPLANEFDVRREQAAPKSMAMKTAPLPAGQLDDDSPTQAIPGEEKIARNRLEKLGIAEPSADRSELAVNDPPVESGKNEDRGDGALESLQADQNPIFGKMMVQGQSIDLVVDEVWLIQIPSTPDNDGPARDLLARSGLLRNDQDLGLNLNPDESMLLTEQMNIKDQSQKSVDAKVPNGDAVEMFLVTADLSAIETLLTQVKQFGSVAPVAPQDIPGLAPMDASFQNEISGKKQSKAPADADKRPEQIETDSELPNAQSLNRQLSTYFNRLKGQGENDNVVYLGNQVYRNSAATPALNPSAIDEYTPKLHLNDGQSRPQDDSKPSQEQANQVDRQLAQSSSTSGQPGLSGGDRGSPNGGGIGGGGGGSGLSAGGQGSTENRAASKERVSPGDGNLAPGAALGQRRLNGRNTNQPVQPMAREFSNRIPNTVDTGRTYNFLVLVQQIPASPPTATVPQSDAARPKNQSESSPESIKKN